MLIIQYLLFLTFFIHVCSIGLHQFRNSWLRIYVSILKNSLKKNNKNYILLDKLNNKINRYSIEINIKYNSLSDDEKLLIENLLSLLY
jgi:hypothetical protein